MRWGAAVVYVADEVQLVHHEVPGQLGQGDGQVDAVAALDGGLDEGRSGAGLGGHALGGQKRSGHGAEVGGNEGVHLGQELGPVGIPVAEATGAGPGHGHDLQPRHPTHRLHGGHGRREAA